MAGECSRRRFLRGAGSALALPFLESLEAAHAAGRPEKARPRRCVFFYIPNGVNVYDWQIQKAGADYVLSEPLRSLERHRAELTPLSGLHHPGALHQQHVCADSWLTGAPLSNGSDSKYVNSVSCDQVIAELTSRETRFPSLELSLTAGVGQPHNSNTLSFSRDGIPLPAEDNPRSIFERLFGEEPGGIKARRERLERRKSVLDAVIEDARTVRRSIGGEDRGKLDDYLSAVRDVETRTERLEGWLDVPKPKVDGTPFQKNVPKTPAGEYYRTMLDLILLTLRTDMTRVVTYMNGSEAVGLALSEIGISNSRHELSHHAEDPERLTRLTKADTYLVETFSGFLDRLKAVTEGEETLLDRTMVLFGSGMSYGHSHGNANVPLVLAGGKSLGLKHGRHLDFNLKKMEGYKMSNRDSIRHLCHHPVNSDAKLSNLLLTLLQCMGGSPKSFSDSSGPLTELLA